MFIGRYINRLLCGCILLLLSFSAKAQFTAAFSVNDSIVCISNTVSFTDLSSGYTGSITNWSWTFGDGGISSVQNPTHAYNTGGIKTVTLTVTDAASQGASVSHTVYVIEAVANPNTIHLCSPANTTTLYSNAPIVSGVTGNWFTPSSATITSPLNDTTQVGNLISGTYLFFWVLSDGSCSDADQVFVIVDNPIVANAGPDQQVCISTATATMAANNPAPGTGTWTTTSSATITTPASPTTTITGLNAVGTYTFIWTITNISCTSTDTVKLVVNAAVTSNAGSDQAICSNPGTATLSATAPVIGSGVWSTTSSATITNPNSVNATVSGLTTAGTYNFIWTVTNGACLSRDTMVITVSQYKAANAGNDLQVCTTTGIATLNGNNPAPGTGLWTTTSIATITSPTSATTGISGMNVAGFYFFVWSISNGACISRDTMVIIVRNPTPSNAGADQNLCNATSASISGNVPASGVGSWSTTSTATITSPSSATTTVTNLPIGNSAFIWTITLGACISRDTVIVHVDSLINANAGADQLLCNVTTATLAGNTATPGTGTWTTTSGATITTPASPTSTVSSLSAGSFNFIWTIVNGTCTTRDTVRITVSTLIVSNAGPDQQICASTPTAALAGNTPASGSGLWTTTSSAIITTPTSPTSTITGLTIAGNYSFVWIITNGSCISRDTVVITVNATVIANAGPDQQLCDAVSTTLAGNNPAPGNGTWTTTSGATITTPSNPNTTITGLSTGVFNFIWTIVNGTCTSRDTVKITVSHMGPINAGPDQQICASTGTTTLIGNTPASGSGLWTTTSSAIITSPSTPNTYVSGLTIAGNYSFVWTITNGACISRDTVVITVDASVIANAGADQQLCSSTSSTILAGNNPSPGNGTWTTTSGATITTPSNPNTTVTGLSAGTFDFVWTIANGSCISRDTVRIVVSNLVVSNAGSDQQICASTAIATMAGNIPASGSGLWTTTSGATITTPSSPTTTVTGLNIAGTYSFVWTITNGTCISRDTVVITVDASVIANAGQDQQLCSSIFSTTLTGNNPSPGNGTWTTISGATITTPSNPNTTVTGLSTGTFDFVWTIVSGTCTSRDTVRINVDSLIIANAGSDQQICASTGSTSLAGNIPSSGSGLWTTTSTATITTPSSSSSSVTGLNIAGSYSFVWTITNGSCNSADTIIITVDSSEIANAGPDQQMCESIDSTMLAANTPTVGSGTWTTTSVAVISNSNNPNTSVTGLTAGNYSFVWNITNGTCSSSDTINIIVDSIPTIANAGIDQTICANSVATITGNTPLTGTGTWTSLNGSTITNATAPSTTVSNLATGNNLFVWTIVNGTCVSADTINIYANANPVADAGTDAFVTSGTSVILGSTPAATGGTSPYTYSWNPSLYLDDSTLANPTSTPLITTVYDLTVTDSLGCSATDTMTVYVNSPPFANNDTLIINEDSITVILPLANDSDADNNINVGSLIIINGPYNGSAFITTDSIIYSPNSNFSGSDSIQYAICDSGLPVYCDTAWIYITILPVNDAPIANDDFTNTPEDSCITINALSNDTDAENNINPSSFVIVTNPNHGTAILDTIAGQIIYCPDSSFNGIDTIMYAICDSGMPVLCDTAYIIVTVTPVNNTPVAINDTLILCSSDSVIFSILNNDTDVDGDTLSASIITMPSHGNAAIDSLYQIGYGATPGYDGSDTIVYLVCDNGIPSLCDTGYVLITVHSNPILTASTTNVKCFGDSSGAIDLTVNGFAPFTYAWNTTDTIEDLDSLIAGVYQVTVLDSNSCASSLIDSVTGPVAPLAVASIVQAVKCFGDSSGSVQLIVSGGTSPYYYLWNTTDTISVIDSLQQGNYSVTVTDTNGCVAMLTDTFTQPASALTASSSLNNIICFGDSTGSIQLNVSGGISPYQYLWNNGDTTSLNDSLTAGIYLVMIADSNGCVLSMSDTLLNLNPAISYNFTTQQPQCINGITGNISVNVSGGLMPYQYLWNTNDTVNFIDSLQSGNYALTITDSSGCVATGNILLTDSISLNLIITGDTSFCSGDSVILSGSYYSNSVYQWYLDSVVITNNDSNNYTLFTGGNYYLTLTNNCGTYSSSSIQVTENMLPLITVTNDFNMECDSSAVLSVSGANTYQWSPSSGLDNTITANPVANPSSSTLYYVIATDVNGCSATDSVKITIACDSLEIPNGFSPNGDNTNDYFVISHISHYPGNRLEIFNRWGNLVYNKEDYDNSWNGFSNVDLVTLGGELTDGTYFYVINLNNGEVRSGYVVLRR